MAHKENPKKELFGIWENRKDIENVDLYVRSMRKGRLLFKPFTGNGRRDNSGNDTGK